MRRVGWIDRWVPSHQLRSLFYATVNQPPIDGALSVWQWRQPLAFVMFPDYPLTTPFAPPLTSAIPSLFRNRSSGCVGEATISEKTPNYRLRLGSVLSTGHGPVGIMGPRDATCKSLGNASPLQSPLTAFYICFEAVNNLLACTNVAVETFRVCKLKPITQTTERWYVQYSCFPLTYLLLSSVLQRRGKYMISPPL